MNRPAKPRPLFRDETRSRPVWRVPDIGPVTPRLRPGNELTRAIGFTVRDYSEKHDDESAS